MIQELEFVFMLFFCDDILERFSRANKVLQNEDVNLKTRAVPSGSLADGLPTSIDNKI